MKEEQEKEAANGPSCGNGNPQHVRPANSTYFLCTTSTRLVRALACTLIILFLDKRLISVQSL